MGTVMLVLHLLAAVIVAGGVRYHVVVARRDPEQLRRFRPVLWLSLLVLVASGAHLLMAGGVLESAAVGLVMLKLTVALVAILLALALTLPYPALARIQAGAAGPGLLLVLLLVVVGMGAAVAARHLAA